MSQKRRVTRLEVAMVAGCGDVAMTPAERAELDAKIGARVEVLVADGSLEFTGAVCLATRPELQHIAEMFTMAMGRAESGEVTDG